MTHHDAHIVQAQLTDRRERILSAISTTHEHAQLTRLLQEVDAALEKIATGTYGVCEICHTHIEAEYIRADPLVRVCLEHLSRDEKQTIERDLELAARVQGKLLPSCNTGFDDWEICFHYEPHGPVGGDYCDLIPPERPGDDSWFFLGDVSGKGVAASLLSAYLHATFRSLAPTGLTLGRLLERANRLLCESTLSSNFVTLVAGRVSAKGEIEIANAGHPHPLIVQAGRIRSIETTGLPLGLFFSGAYRTVRTTMAPGDTLFVYSDGLSESRNAAMDEYSDARVSAFVAREHTAASDELIRRTVADLSGFRGDQPKADDLTIMALKRRG